MDLPKIITDYFEAWNCHDPAAIVACFTEGGAYFDPDVPQGVGGAALVRYATAIFRAMPDVHFDISSSHGAGDMRTAEWRMTAAPNIDLRGVDIFVLQGDRIVEVRGYYDRKTLDMQRETAMLMQALNEGKPGEE